MLAVLFLLLNKRVDDSEATQPDGFMPCML